MGFHQAKNWVDLGEWGKGMDGNKLPASSDLAGKAIQLHVHNTHAKVACEFSDAGFLRWDTGVSTYVAEYEAINITGKIYFVDFVSKDKPNVSVSMVIDLHTGKATILTAALPEPHQVTEGFKDRLGKGVDLSNIQVQVRHASIHLAENSLPGVHERTADLIGKRIKYTYSSDHVYEHIYLNERFYTWHCLEGVEKGLADTEVCNYFKIAPDTYLFSWQEKIMPTFGLVVIDLRNMRSNGKTFGLDIAAGRYINFTMGALAQYL